MDQHYYYQSKIDELSRFYQNEREHVERISHYLDKKIEFIRKGLNMDNSQSFISPIFAPQIMQSPNTRKSSGTSILYPAEDSFQDNSLDINYIQNISLNKKPSDFFGSAKEIIGKTVSFKSEKN